MNNIKKKRFLNWLMYFICFFCMGPTAIGGWTVYQLFCYEHDIEVENDRKKIPEERSNIIKLNKKENLTEKEELYLKTHQNKYKMGEINGIVIYGYRKSYKNKK